MQRKHFIRRLGLVSVAFTLAPKWSFSGLRSSGKPARFVAHPPLKHEDLFGYIRRINGSFDLTIYRELLGYCNEFKEGDEIAGLAAPDEQDRLLARNLLSETKLQDIVDHPVFEDHQSRYIRSCVRSGSTGGWTFRKFKHFLLNGSEEDIQHKLDELHSDQIACVVKLMSNEELIRVSSKIFHPLPGSRIGSKGYMGARVQPNSPTDDPEDVFWQVMNAWSFAVGDVVLGTNPVSSDPASVAILEKTLHEILVTFDLEQVMPHCVLAHIDIQSQVEEEHPGTTGIWFQSIAGTDDANGTFDVSLEKMQRHVSRRNGKYGLYAETGQGADETNGHGSGFDMLFHESRKYGMMRGLKQQILQQKPDHQAWVHVNDVAGFIGPEVFRTREQLVRCCLEDIVMGKLHGLTIGLDICTTLHMDVSLSDLDWCIDRIMPANPAYLMALPTKNDPMLSYLTTSYVDHVRIREKFGYKVNDAMWDFFKSIDIIGADNQPTARFADPLWVYYQYLKRKGDARTWSEIEAEGKQAIERVRERGVPVATGHGEHAWDLKPELDAEIRSLYEDAKMCIWQEWPAAFYPFKENSLLLQTASVDRKDYIYHPQSGERLSPESDKKLKSCADRFSYDFQVVLSDGLNVLSLTDDEHLVPFLDEFNILASANSFLVSPQLIQLKNGRVRAGYEVGKTLFKNKSGNPVKGIIHLIGERPGTKHRSYSVYLTLATVPEWSADDKIDHNITRVISGISNTSLLPKQAAKETVSLIQAHLLSKRN